MKGLLDQILYPFSWAAQSIRLRVLRYRYPTWMAAFLSVAHADRLPERVGYPHAERFHIPEIRAWTLSWVMVHEQTDQLLGLLGSLGYPVKAQLPTQLLRRSLPCSNDGQRDPSYSISDTGQNVAVYLCQHSAFGGTMVTLVTNDLPCVDRIQAEHNWLVPLPTVAFPDVEPDSLGELQGDLAYWWDYYWRPFWLSRSQQQRCELNEKLSTLWRDFIADRAV